MRYPSIPERMVLAGLSEGVAKQRRVRAMEACIDAPAAPWKWMRMRIHVQRKGGTADLKPVLQPDAAARFIHKVMPQFATDTVENVVVLACDTRGVPVGLAHVHIGARATTVASPADILRPVLVAAPATRFVLAHNHPSGNASASELDMDLFARMQTAAEQVGLRCDDFIAVTETEVYSCAARNTYTWRTAGIDGLDCPCRPRRRRK
jgi:hypothetical protein